MTEVGARVRVEMTEMQLAVIRCNCGEPGDHPNSVCPQGVSEPPQVLRHYRNPLRQFVWDHLRRQ